jgi:hypothetical protein
MACNHLPSHVTSRRIRTEWAGRRLWESLSTLTGSPTATSTKNLSGSLSAGVLKDTEETAHLFQQLGLDLESSIQRCAQGARDGCNRAGIIAVSKGLAARLDSLKPLFLLF